MRIFDHMTMHIDDLTILIHRPPERLLLPIDLDKDLVDVKCVAVSTMISLQPSSVYSAKLVTPQANRFIADGDASLGE